MSDRSREPLQIACATSAAFLPHAAAMLRSVLDHAGRPVAVHVLHGADLTAADRAALGAMVREAGAAFTTHRVDPATVTGLPPHFDVAGWYRILLPDVLKDLPRVLYLDADLIAVGDLEPLWTAKFNGALLGAVTNVLERHHAGHPAQLGMAPGQPYFNSGVLLLDLAAMRREGSATALLALARERGDALTWSDQDALNLALGTRRLALHPRWNVMNAIRLFAWAPDVLGAGAVAEALAHPAIVHFEGPWANKPWHVRCEHPFRDEYLALRARTPWPGVVLDESEPPWPATPPARRGVRGAGGAWARRRR